MNKQSNQLVESFYRCINSGTFADTFYDLFLSKGPEIAQKFAATDFTHQKLMLRQSLLELLAFDRGLADTSEEIERLGQRHKELEITPQMYAMWLDALCETIEMHDPQYTPELEQQWRDAMQVPIDQMIAIRESN
jgi:hemoglobin-like flavoprotein